MTQEGADGRVSFVHYPAHSRGMRTKVKASDTANSQLLNKLTDFYEILYQFRATGRHMELVPFNFLQSVKTDICLDCAGLLWALPVPRF